MNAVMHTNGSLDTFFQPKTWLRGRISQAGGGALYSARKLEYATLHIIAPAIDDGDEGNSLRRDDRTQATRTAVVASREFSAGSIHQLFRSYVDGGGIGNLDDCMIWEAA